LIASDDYFRAMHIPLIAGRAFDARDHAPTAAVAIVNRSMADRYWSGQNPVGRRISPGDHRWFTIVGVIANVRQQLTQEPTDEIYVPMLQRPYVSTNWVIRTTLEPMVIAPLVRDAVRKVDPDQPIHRMRTLDEVRSASLASPRLTTTLLALFAALALVITAVGIAGVIAFSVNQRSQEFGVRVAFGARRFDVVTMVVAEGIRLTLGGLAIGVGGSVFLAGLLSTVLFGVEPTDVLTYLAVSLVLLGVAALACLIPAIRAASVDPIQALRAN
jgi:putative ABC transport system permease protein